MHSDLPQFLCATREYLTEHPGSGPHVNLTDMSWCMLVALSLQEVGIEAVLEAGRMYCYQGGHKDQPAVHPPFLFHSIRFHDPATPNEVLFTDTRGNDTLETIASAAARAYDWVRDPLMPLEMQIKTLDTATREAFYSEEFTGRLKAFLQSRTLEHDTAQPDRTPPRPRL